jgi:hypothetical protein
MLDAYKQTEHKKESFCSRILESLDDKVALALQKIGAVPHIRNKSPPILRQGRKSNWNGAGN